ncbi:tyrosine-protein phosphatase non-receptor type 21 [Strongylocentrotus purpuratus]|uniref:protein-tyrosine-phosphatase n=1 Tax=Strongylocentrotus purpuratus TaxID=7668 RepID=A0A7M7LSI2_STRPU|nr:tyrosine-protein phosphatase non-receptor type 21 [Strongylocentrotus purpuratus]|eukprot:XP_011661487.1 PREDICTED: tyrosine-protein phosphatase non-receptor type 21 [Strongylocentrotus purpuratus]
MPFGLRLKKTRRYNVSGKNSFVARIQLLDSAVLEITLTPESLGQDCLDTIAQKLQLEENIYFGLQYSNKNYKLRWVDLEKPLKKQLDKNAHDSMLRLGVMLYTTNIQTLRHEMTRYMYFLQLKSDFIEGILPCNEEQAVTLASFALQAEIGNSDPAKHTVEFYQNEYVLLPKNMTTENVSLSELLLKVMNAHQAKVGMSTCQSELGYIEQAAKLQGYGQESFPAKDDSGNELFISASFSGLSVKHLNRQETVHFEWHEVVSMGHNRRAFGVGTSRSHDVLQFQMEDAETAKYVCRICRLQQQFHKYTVETVKLGSREVLVDGFPADKLITVVDPERRLSMDGQQMSGKMRNRDSLILGEGASSEENLPHHMMADGQLGNQQFIIGQTGNTNFTTSQLSLDNQHAYDMGPFTTSQLSLDRPPTDYSYSNGNLVMLDQNGSVYSAPSVNSLNYGLHNQVSPNSSNPSLTNNEKVRAHLQASLPAYRQSPDYEAFIQARLQQRLLTVSEQSQSVGNLGKQNGYGHMESVLYPQPELRQHNHNNHYRQQFRLSYGGTPNNYYTGNNMDYSLESLQHGLLIKTPHGNIVHTISVPELTSEHIQTTEEYITAKLLKNKYKPPPPYPRGSASTPNLARQSNNYLVSSSSPDLVSRRLQAIEAMHEVNLHGSGNVNIDADLSQSLPIEAFQQMRIQDYHAQVGMYSRHVSQGYQQQYSPQQREFKPALTLNLTDKAQPSDLSMIAVPTGYEDNLPTPPDKSRIMSPFQEYAGPLVSPPSEFADHSDIDSNMSPGSVGSPTRHFHLPPHGMGDIYNSQPSLPENHLTYVTGGFGQMNGTGQLGSPTRVYSMPQLHPEMREVNPSHYAMLHVDQANYVNTVQGFHGQQQQQHHTSEIETILAERKTNQSQGFATSMHANPKDNITQETPLNDHTTQSSSPTPALPQSTDDVHSHKPKQPELKASSVSSKPSTNPPSTTQQPSTSKASSTPPATSSSNHKQTVASKSPTLPLSPDSEGSEVLEDLGTDNGGYIGPLKLAAMSGLTLLRPRDMPAQPEEETKHPRDARRKILEKQLREGQVFTEYEQITKKREGAVCYTSKLPENVSRNRFKDVLPYEDCRVELSSSHHNSGGYINASRVKVPVAGELLHYIAAQGPMENTVQDWWRMVWESGTQVIAMLTKLKEDGKEKCFKYWPDCTSPKKNTAEFGPFRVIAQFSNDSGCYITSGLTLRHVPSGEQRTVWHLQYNDWPNQGCPDDVHGFLSFLEEFQSVCRHANSMNEVEVGPPPIVHCSAGVGRTGVLLLVDIMISSLEHNEEINIPKMMGILRQQRMLMVQTVGQYTFVYKALIQSLKNTRLI